MSNFQNKNLKIKKRQYNEMDNINKSLYNNYFSKNETSFFYPNKKLKKDFSSSFEININEIENDFKNLKIKNFEEDIEMSYNEIKSSYDSYINDIDSDSEEEKLNSTNSSSFYLDLEFPKITKKLTNKVIDNAIQSEKTIHKIFKENYDPNMVPNKR
jgi:hypothetical protein